MNRLRLPAPPGANPARRRTIPAVGLAVCLLMSVALPALAHAAADTSAPVALAAEEVTHDRSLDIVTARGDVEINQAGYTLYADTVSYNINQDMVTASGNVSLIAPDGNVVFADYMQLTGKMKSGAIQNLLMVSNDLSRTAAHSGTRRIGDDGQQINELDHVVYSPCDTCAGSANPLWQIKAKRVVHDEQSHDITYRDATLEMWGVPVAYTPYFSNPDPTVKRRSGLLFPTMGSAANVGTYYTQPYYWVTSPNSDVTLAPMITTDDPSILIGQYRQNLPSASFVIDASGRAGGHVDDSTTTDSSGNSYLVEGGAANRGSLKVVGEWDVNDVWRASTELNAVSSDTYLRRYRLPHTDDYQTNRVALEGFNGDDYTVFEALSFRELRDLDTDVKNPYALPIARWIHNSEPGTRGGYWTTQLSTASLTRTDGNDSYRVSGSTAWTLPYVAPSGEHYTLGASLRSDVYQVQDYVKLDGESFTGATGRIIPEVTMRWSWPFASSGDYSTQVIEPVLVGALSPNGGNPSNIPNEDSRDLDFDDTQLLDTNHFVGYDRVETGPRATYGVNWNAYVHNSPSVFSAFAGQTYRVHGDSAFPDGAGLREGPSDYVGRVRYRYGRYFDAFYRFRLDQKDLSVVSNDVTASFGVDPAKISVGYLKQDYSTRADYDTTSNSEVEQISLGLSSRVSRDWTLSVGTTHSLAADSGGPLSLSSRLTYEDECFLFRIVGSKDYTTDRDAEAGWGVMMQLVFKTIGDTGFSL